MRRWLKRPAWKLRLIFAERGGMLDRMGLEAADHVAELTILSMNVRLQLGALAVSAAVITPL